MKRKVGKLNTTLNYTENKIHLSYLYNQTDNKTSATALKYYIITIGKSSYVRCL